MPPRDFDLDIQAIRRRLEREGWMTRPFKGPHDIYAHPERAGTVAVPRGRGDLPAGTARSIARAAGWTKGRQES
ncbi:type II toxin-antitoxin system HicA family toxin [Methylobacterium sp. WL103]|nr:MULTISPECIES: type II toxin-antitoxin system HicA family toxin [Methylobacterium]TXN09802.1 type II toxin-antitoxin system HicA family toxin [Methylobacterium sp. WL122]TXM68888.1 type II toxin-antitoxin system HicA family toxin [Methylobacterium sp. WL120]TXM75055.1 type II toxin-antitoxin system HicA family toxin [Methylobacterium sp. WL12]TXN04145.1 type II toxin-antitoxin system HicA family toxin [Methylobacterium sp. WL103]TXN80854.1 type II toxin-antitoxin system HicA family toxin [Me